MGCITPEYVSKDSHIIVRCEPELRARLQRIALLERRELSSLARIVFEDYIAAQESKLGLTHYGLRDSSSSGGGLAAAAKIIHAAADAAHGAKLATGRERPITFQKSDSGPSASANENHRKSNTRQRN